MAYIHYRLSNMASTVIANTVIDEIYNRYNKDYNTAPELVQNAWDRILKSYIPKSTPCIIDASKPRANFVEQDMLVTVAATGIGCAVAYVSENFWMAAISVAFILGVYITLMAIRSQNKSKLMAMWRKSHISAIKFMISESRTKIANNVTVSGMYVYPTFMSSDLAREIKGDNPYLPKTTMPTIHDYYLVSNYLNIRILKRKFHESDLNNTIDLTGTIEQFK